MRLIQVPTLRICTPGKNESHLPDTARNYLGIPADEILGKGTRASGSFTDINQAGRIHNMEPYHPASDCQIRLFI